MAKRGRPTDYDPKFCDELIEYFSIPPYKITADGEKPNDFPSYSGFAARIGIHRGTMNDWVKRHADFAEAYACAKEHQENFLLVNAMKGLIPPASWIFVAKNALRYRDVHPDDVQASLQPTMSPEQFEEYCARMAKVRRK
jgi:hypothetical protein